MLWWHHWVPAFLTLGFGERDKARMHDLAVRNQEDALSPVEKEELFAYAKAGSLLSRCARSAAGPAPPSAVVT